MDIRQERITSEEYIRFLARTDLGSQYPQERFEERIGKLVKNASISLTARDGGELVGVCFGITDFAYWLFITDLGIDRRYVRQGLGKQLLRRALEIAGGEKDIIMYTCANENAVPFYEKFGMSPAQDMMEYNHVDWTPFTVTEPQPVPKQSIDHQLSDLREQMSKRQRLSAQIDTLNAQAYQVESKVTELEWSLKHEEDDLTELLNNRWKCLWYQLTGKFDQIYSQEQIEVLGARSRYEAAAKELAEIKTEIEQLRDERMPYQNADRAYEKLMQQKLASLRTAGTPDGERLLDLESQLQRAEYQLKELNEAMDASRRAVFIISDLAVHLSAASTYAAWDTMGGGVVADTMKYSEMEEAQKLLEKLQNQLRHIHTELADVQIALEADLHISDFTLFADVFADSIFIDLRVKKRIEQAQKQLAGMEDKLMLLIMQLKSKAEQPVKQIARLKAEIDAFLLHTAQSS